MKKIQKNNGDYLFFERDGNEWQAVPKGQIVVKGEIIAPNKQAIGIERIILVYYKYEAEYAALFITKAFTVFYEMPVILASTYKNKCLLVADSEDEFMPSVIFYKNSQYDYFGKIIEKSHIIKYTEKSVVFYDDGRMLKISLIGREYKLSPAFDKQVQEMGAAEVEDDNAYTLYKVDASVKDKKLLVSVFDEKTQRWLKSKEDFKMVQKVHNGYIATHNGYFTFLTLYDKSVNDIYVEDAPVAFFCILGEEAKPIASCVVFLVKQQLNTQVFVAYKDANQKFSFLENITNVSINESDKTVEVFVKKEDGNSYRFKF